MHARVEVTMTSFYQSQSILTRDFKILENSSTPLLNLVTGKLSNVSIRYFNKYQNFEVETTYIYIYINFPKNMVREPPGVRGPS